MFKLIIIYFFIFLTNISFAADKPLYFIQGQPQGTQYGSEPYPTIIFRANKDFGNIEPVWSTGDNIHTYDIRIFFNAGYVLISEGQWHPKNINVIHMNEINRIETFDIKVESRLLKYRFYYNPKNVKQFDLKYWYGDIGPNPNNYKYFNITRKNNDYDADSIIAANELILGGPLPAYGSAYSDVLGLQIGGDGIITPKESIIDLEDTVIPKGLIKSDSTSGWMLIHNEPSFRIILSIPNRHGLMHRELLIFNRITTEWQSIMIEGSETTPRLINNWLVGVIADTDPETDYIIKKGFPPILRESVVLVNPISGHQFTVHLGKKGEILWIENYDVYYRVGEELYKAQIENNDFVDRTLLLTDPVVDFIHLAFRGK